MRGQFDNSVGWLANMPSSVLSTEENAARFADALKRRTSTPWIVKLVPVERCNGGGFFISPLDERLRQGEMGRRDWNHLRRLFGAVETPTCRWYLFPDELVAAFEELNLPVYREAAPKSTGEKVDGSS